MINVSGKNKSSSNLVIRIACHELESWYFGDLTAVEKALKREGLIKYKVKKKYRDPDNIQNPSKELEKITKGDYQKNLGSKAIGSLDKNTSPSFQSFVKGIQKLCNIS